MRPIHRARRPRTVRPIGIGIERIDPGITEEIVVGGAGGIAEIEVIPHGTTSWPKRTRIANSNLIYNPCTRITRINIS